MKHIIINNATNTELEITTKATIKYFIFSKCVINAIKELNQLLIDNKISYPFTDFSIIKVTDTETNELENLVLINRFLLNSVDTYTEINVINFTLNNNLIDNNNPCDFTKTQKITVYHDLSLISTDYSYFVNNVIESKMQPYFHL